MRRRSCQPCTACCEGWLSSKHIAMSPGKPCKHCTSSGCAIYATRPESPCRTFECEWVRPGSPLPDGLRPDVCGAIVLPDRDFHGWQVLMATPTGWQIPRETLRQLMHYAREQNTPLVYIENFSDSNGSYSHFSRSGYGPKPFMDTIARHARGLELIEI